MIKRTQLTKEEKAILDSYEQGEWKSVKNLKAEKERYGKIAAESLKKNRRVNIRITEKDLQRIQIRAVEEGIPYQTLMASVIHKYVSGRLVEQN